MNSQEQASEQLRAGRRPGGSSVSCRLRGEENERAAILTRQVKCQSHGHRRHCQPVPEVACVYRTCWTECGNPRTSRLAAESCLHTCPALPAGPQVQALGLPPAKPWTWNSRFSHLQIILSKETCFPDSLEIVMISNGPMLCSFVLTLLRLLPGPWGAVTPYRCPCSITKSQSAWQWPQPLAVLQIPASSVCRQ